jgi:hypothetical protein
VDECKPLETGKTCEILVPDGVEFRRAKKVFASSLELSDGQGLTLVPISAQSELFCPPYDPN